MKKIGVALVLILSMAAAIRGADAKKNVVRVPGGTYIPQAGIVIDAGYDRRFDGFIPGYKVINVALVNQSFNIISLDPEKDRWSIRLEGKKRPYSAVHDLRGQDPMAWSQIPERAKGLVDYPLVLPIGAREVVDIFVPDSVDAERFNELDVYINSMDTKFEILVRQ